MGLDSLNLLTEIERTFNIKISDNVAEKTNTVGKLYNVVWQNVRHNQTDKCNTQKLFYKLRAGIVNEKESATTIHPNSLLEDIFIKSRRRKMWKQLEHRTMLKLPPLVLPRSLVNLLIVCSLLIIGLGVYFSIHFSTVFNTGYWTLIPALIISTILIRIAIVLFTPFRRSFSVVSMKDLTNKVLALNFATLTSDGTTRAEVEMILNNLISDVAGLDISDISAERSFVYDLGIN